MPSRAPVHHTSSELVLLKFKRTNKPRGSARERGYTKRWERYSKDRLKRYPLCVQCEIEGDLSAGHVTDHKIPHRGNNQLFWDPTNHQTLCLLHHNRKTVLEDGGFGNAPKHHTRPGLHAEQVIK